ncbi:DUF3265 domain-containing protein [Vibrio parahaemolyticus]|nr:DUF3265 domain-containing protein [Vibrio parahaemolyticus]EGR3355925.1 DUF3265 domain-containing protein [Vibrio parahaemolyticus]EJG1852738.1 DUF3265 domain-containing protein [Vibrio parahaemolyticus]ELI1808558.1 DUF3265 domain-containing protein [Vibrio parahaemolyticus]MBE3888642.1 DUF3265 domain-containing protein [Vibrio parahaemolyticus]
MRNAWHFYHALILVIKVVCGNIVLRCSPLKRALASKLIMSLSSSLFFVYVVQHVWHKAL